MKKFVYMIIIIVLLTSSGSLTSHASSEELIISVETTSLEFGYKELPTISGIITNEVEKPLSDVRVSASFPYVNAATSYEDTNSTIMMSFITNDDGKFVLQPPTPSPIGAYAITITANQDKISEDVIVNYYVTENSGISTSGLKDNSNTTINTMVESSNIENISKNDNITSDLILREIELQKKQIAQKQNQINQEKNQRQFVEQQRQLVQIELEKDLRGFDEKYEAHSAKNAFASFIAKIDSSMQKFFWDQFAFTQKISEQAYQAKITVLEQGKTPQQAMKVFQEEAAVTHEELVEYNKELNIKYGFADQTSQDKFYEKGKFPRIEN